MIVADTSKGLQNMVASVNSNTQSVTPLPQRSDQAQGVQKKKDDSGQDNNKLAASSSESDSDASRQSSGRRGSVVNITD